MKKHGVAENFYSPAADGCCDEKSEEHRTQNITLFDADTVIGINFKYKRVMQSFEHVNEFRSNALL